MKTYSINSAAGKVIAATASSGNTALTGYETVRQVKLSNAGPNAVFVRFGGASQTAVTTDFCVLATESVVVNLPPGSTNIGAICVATQTAALYVSPVVTAN